MVGSTVMPRTSKAFTLKANAMKMAHIQYSQYYEKLFQQAMDKRVIQTTMDRNGRVVVIRAYS